MIRRRTPLASPGFRSAGIRKRVRALRVGCLALLCSLALPGLGRSAAAESPASSESGTPIVPQGLAIQHWTVKDGLPVDGINDLYREPNGYLWVATSDGLLRFDGDRFERFHTGNTPQLGSNRILHVTGNPDGSLWVRTEGFGTAFFRDGVFQPLTFEGEPPRPIGPVYVTTSGAWLGTGRGLYRIDSASLIAHPATDPAHGPIQRILEAEEGVLWILTWTSIGRCDGSEVEWLRPAGVPTEGLRDIAQDREGELWIASNSGLYVGSAEQLDRLIAGEFWQVVASEDRVWAKGETGTLELDSGRRAVHLTTGSFFNYVLAATGDWFSDGQLLNWRGHTLSIDGLRGAISALLTDSEGTAWVGTPRGLFALRPGIVSSVGTAEGLASDSAYSLAEQANGAIWVGMRRGGVSRLTGSTVESFGLEAGLDQEIVLGLHVDRGDQLWAGTERLFSWDGDHFVLEAGLDRSRILAISDGPSSFGNGSLLVGNAQGLWIRRSGSWTSLTERDGLPPGGVRTLLVDRDDALWMGTTTGGIARWQDDQILRITTLDGLPSNRIRALWQGPDGSLWIGTEDVGLARLRLGGTESIAIQSIDESQGLFDNSIHSIVPDGEGRLWMSSNRGLFTVALSELDAFFAGEASSVNSVGLDDRDGMRNREANGGTGSSGLRASDGRLWFATQGGVAVLDPATVAGDVLGPPVRIEAVKLGKEPSRALPPPQLLELAPEERNFALTFTALSPVDADRITFRYQLDGYDPTWIDAGARREASYAKVPAGDYLFRVEAKYPAGSWRGTNENLNIHVDPYFRETLAFRVLCISGILVAMILLLLLQARRLASRRRELERQVEERTHELSTARDQAIANHRLIAAQTLELEKQDRRRSELVGNISHELRTPLALTLQPLDQLLENPASPWSPEVEAQLNLARMNSRRILDLADQLLYASFEDGERPRLEATVGDLRPVLEEIAQSYLSMAGEQAVKLTVDLGGERLGARFDRDSVHKIVGNLLSNAFKFSPPAGVVQFTARRLGNSLQVAVRDEGSGVPEADRERVFERFVSLGERSGLGVGLHLARSLAENLGGTLTIETNREAQTRGATFVWTTPHSDIPADAIADSTPAPLRSSAQPKRSERPTTPATILVVEDHPDLRRMVREALAHHYKIIEASHGGEALDAIASRDTPPDLILSDVMMPVMDGFALFKSLRTNLATSTIPFVFLTSRALKTDRLAALGLGASDYVTKPFHATDLLARVRSLLDPGVQPAAPIPEPDRDHALTPDERVFLARLEKAMDQGHPDPDFGVEQLAAAMAMDRSHLFRRLRDLRGVSPSSLLIERRLEAAVELLESSEMKVSGIAYAVGFKSVQHFSHRFRKRFGVPPSLYGSDAYPGPPN